MIDGDIAFSRSGLNLIESKSLIGLVELALLSLDMLEKDSRYYIHPGVYHLPMQNKCRIGFAGCLVAAYLEIDPTVPISIVELACISPKLAARCEALTQLSTGNMKEFFSIMGMGHDERTGCIYEKYRYVIVPRYTKYPELFKEKIRSMIEDLRRAGFE